MHIILITQMCTPVWNLSAEFIPNLDYLKCWYTASWVKAIYNRITSYKPWLGYFRMSVQKGLLTTTEG